MTTDIDAAMPQEFDVTTSYTNGNGTFHDQLIQDDEYWNRIMDREPEWMADNQTDPDHVLRPIQGPSQDAPEPIQGLNHSNRLIHQNGRKPPQSTVRKDDLNEHSQGGEMPPQPERLPDESVPAMAVLRGKPETQQTRKPTKSLAELQAEIDAITDPGRAALEQWAIAITDDAALLSEQEFLMLKSFLTQFDLTKSFLDRDWQPLVKKRGKELQAEHAQSQREVLKNAPRYVVSDGKICQMIERVNNETGEFQLLPLPLANFVAQIAADVEKDDGEEIERFVAIHGALSNGDSLPEITIEAGEFESMAWVVSKWGSRASVEPGRGTRDRLRHAIQEMSDPGMRRIFTHTGWTIIDGERVFLTCSGALDADGVDVELPQNLAHYCLPTDNEFAAADAMKQSIALLDVAPAHLSCPLLAAMYLAPLSELITPSFVVWVEGPSGSFKSTYTSLMLNHFGAAFTENNMPADWLGTANSLERLCFHAKDIPLIIDDFRPATDRFQNNKMLDSASRVIRAVGNRSGRSRLTGESKLQRTFAPRGVVISTAERGALGQSTNARLLTVNVEPGDIDQCLLSEAQAQRNVYGYAMAGYLRWLAKNWTELETSLPASVAEVRERNSAGGHHKRLPNAMAIMHTAFCLAMHYALHIGAIDEYEMQRRSQECYDALQSITDEQFVRVEEENPVDMLLRTIIIKLRQEEWRIDSSLGAALGGAGAGVKNYKQAVTIGWHDGKNIYLLSDAHHLVCTYFSQEGRAFPVDETTLAKELERRGFISETDEGRLKVQKRVPGKHKSRRRVLALRFNKVLEFAGEMGINRADLEFVPISDEPGDGIPW